MRRADRLFELIHLLRRARKAVTAVQLAEALEIAPGRLLRLLRKWVCGELSQEQSLRVTVNCSDESTFGSSR